MSKIVGHDWDAVQRAQQRGRLSPLIDTSKRASPDASDEDRALLAAHGLGGLEFLGYHGVIDRLVLAGCIPPLTCNWKREGKRYVIGCKSKQGVYATEGWLPVRCSHCGKNAVIEETK